MMAAEIAPAFNLYNPKTQVSKQALLWEVYLLYGTYRYRYI